MRPLRDRAQDLMRTPWFRQQKATLRRNEYPTLAQAVDLIESVAQHRCRDTHQGFRPMRDGFDYDSSEQ